ncbi:sialate:O-sulfotransferase 2-like [Asterias amurensis]|uniref:sialate:O-sulfotransferase 2-like n=1 Tax=Asterias amurensis TaxID=7602 RepID=UPI003AB25CC6
MRSKRRHKAGGWLARLLPCHLRHRDSTLFKLTVLVCLVFPGYILLFNHFSNLGLPGEIRQGGEQAQETPGRTLHLEPVKSTQSTSLHQSRLKKDALLGDISQGKAVRGDGGNQDTSVVRQERDLHQGRGLVNYSQHKTQLISGIRVLYLGCYRDETERTLRALREGFLTDLRRMTVALCVRHCSKRGSYYAGLEFHSECYCGKRIYHNQPVRDNLCNATCAGNTTSTCGGAPYLSMYQILVENGHHATGGQQAQQIAALDTGLADDFRACLPRPITPWKQSIFLDGFVTFDDKLTITSCIATCSEKKFPLAALGAGTECHCGAFSPEYRMQKVLPLGDCNIPCRGDVKYYCGGDGAVSLYQTAAEDTRCNGTITLKPEGTMPLVAVSSFPGSGNTWVRYLIERATGIYTGSFYNDGVLFKQGFMGEREKWTKGNTIGVKTHRFDEKHVRQFEAAVLIIRNPYKAIISEHNRKFGGHVGFAPEAQYTKGTEWTAFVTGKSRTWANTAVNFIQYSKRVHVVYYEDLQTNLYDNLKRIVKFLKVPVDEERLLCVLSSPLGKFKRSGKPKLPSTFDPYTEEMKEMVDLSLKTVSMALKLRNCTGLPKDYDPRIQL